MDEARPPDSREPELVFVYGLLMRGFDLHHYMSGAEFLGEGKIAGRLISLGRYPGLVAGEGEVCGELYRFADLAPALEVLDDVEEYDPANPEGSLYLRTARAVRTDDGRTLLAWTYAYNKPPTGAPAVTSGDWRRR